MDRFVWQRDGPHPQPFSQPWEKGVAPLDMAPKPRANWLMMCASLNGVSSSPIPKWGLAASSLPIEIERFT
jgi:hypothetical protein